MTMARPLDPMTFPLHGTRLIEASAGTGKTYTIAGLYLRLVLGHGGPNGFARPLAPPEILVVTFTNAATEELRDRIRRRLARAAAFFRGQASGDDDLVALRRSYTGDQWPGRAHLLDQAAQWMDQASIHTIHGWCQRMLRQHAFDSNSLFDLELAPDERDLLEAAACDYWRCQLYPLPADQLTALTALTGCDTPQQLLARIRPLLEAPPCGQANPFEMLSRRQQAVQAARRCWLADFDRAVEKIRTARADKTLNGNKYRQTSLDGWIVQLADWVHADGPLPDDPVLARFSRTGLAAGTARNRSAPDHPAFDATDRLMEVLSGVDIPTALFRHAAEGIAKRFQAEKQRRGRMDFNDLLTRLHAALHAPDGEGLARLIRRRLPVALIDEFQDTDRLQYAIFSRIYAGRADTGLFMIGDPKQAIYAFRGADIHTYLTARRDTDGRHYTLGKNFRAATALVEAVNQMFSAAATYPEGPFLFGGQIPFDRVAARGRPERLVVAEKPADGLHCWLLPQDAPVTKTGENGYLSQMAQAAAAEIVRLLSLSAETPSRAGFMAPDGRMTPLRPADMAILVRSGSEARTMRKALDARNVPSVYLSDRDSVFHGGEGLSLLYLLRACAEPEQARLVRTALATELLDLPFSRLDRLNRDEAAWEAEVERFGRYRQIWQHQGVLPMLRTLLREFRVPARLLTADGGERTLTNVLHLSELLQAAALELDGEQALIRWLTEQRLQADSATDEQILRLESDDERIRVVTVHKSKGLEYPLVFLPFICSFRPVTRQNAPLVAYHDENGRLKRVLTPRADDLAAADHERLAEDLRLLYVAVTRACHACWLGLGVMGRSTRKGQTSTLHRSGLGYLLSPHSEIAAASLAEKLADLKGGCEHITLAPLPEPDTTGYRPRTAGTGLLPARQFSGHVSRDWRITSYSGILTGAQLAFGAPDQGAGTDGIDFADSAVEDQLREAAVQGPEAPPIRSKDRSIHGFPRGPEPGTFLHDLLEWAAREGFGNLAGDRQRICDKLTEMARIADQNDWIDVLADWLQDLLQIPLMLPDPLQPVALAALYPDTCQPELEFLLAAHGIDTLALDAAVTEAVLPGARRPRLRKDTVNGMLKGFIDLVFCHQGRYFVVDYKSNFLGINPAAYGPATMADAMLEHRYDLQYALYTLALHRLLKARRADYDYQRDVGGVIYLFLRGVTARGQGVYFDKPPVGLIEKLDQAFAGQKDYHAR